MLIDFPNLNENKGVPTNAMLRKLSGSSGKNPKNRLEHAIARFH